MASNKLSGCVAAWWFDEGSGFTANDNSGNGLNSTLFGAPLPSWVTGKYQSGLQFIGNLGYYQGVQTPSFAFSGKALTFVFWIYMPNELTYDGIIIGDNNQNGTAGYILIYARASDDLSYQYANGSSPATVQSPGYFTGYYGTWVYVAIVADYSGNTVNFYRNGLFVSQSSMTTPLFPSGKMAKYIGTYENGSYNFGVTATLDEFQIYNRILSQTEIQTLMAQSVNARVNMTFEPFTGAKPPGTFNVNWTLKW